MRKINLANRNDSYYIDSLSPPQPAPRPALAELPIGANVIVCICHRVSDRDIEREARLGCTSFAVLQQALRVATGCGACTGCAQEVFAQCARPCGGGNAQRVLHAPLSPMPA